jgi:hypothetical protein
MAWVHIIGAMFLVASQWMDVHVVYKQVSPLFKLAPVQATERIGADSQGWMQVSGSVRPVPWQLWPESDQKTFKLSAYLLTVTFWALQIAHAEEVSPLTPLASGVNGADMTDDLLGILDSSD